MDDFVGEPDALLGELLARLVGDLHGALDAPAEAVCLRQLHGDGAPGVLVPILLERLDHITCGTESGATPSANQDKNRRIGPQVAPPPPRRRGCGLARAQVGTHWCTPGS